MKIELDLTVAEADALWTFIVSGECDYEDPLSGMPRQTYAAGQRGMHKFADAARHLFKHNRKKEVKQNG
jgi:hypothetical protein